MMVLTALVALAVVLGTGVSIWKLWRHDGNAPSVGATSRRREDARDWQRRFGADSLPAANFLQPTQNEILETLSVLDHLTPGWENHEAAVVERHFLNELALSFPTLRKTSCAFPIPFADTLAALGTPTAREEDFAVKREAFQISRAQFNALEQITSGPVALPESATDSLPCEPAEAGAPGHFRNPWPVRLAGLAAALAVVLGVALRFPATTRLSPAKPPLVQDSAPVEPAEPTVPAPSSPSPIVSNGPVVAASPAPPAPMPAASAAPVLAQATSAQAAAPPPSPAQERSIHDQQVAASQQRAVARYPALAVEDSEINLRFVFRYKNLVQQNSPRLLDPNWPEQLAEECAVAAGMSPKHGAFAQVRGTSR